MNAITKLFRLIARRRIKELERYRTEPDKVQAEQLRRITQYLSHSRYGTEHGVEGRIGYSSYTRRIPIVTYEKIAPRIEQMLSGEKRVLCGERVDRFAKSSGTTNAKSKYVPVNKTHLRQSHYKGGMDSILTYLTNHPESDFFAHKAFALAGSSAPTEGAAGHIRTGDLSAILLEEMPAVGRYVRIPRRELVLHPHWQTKLDTVSSAVIGEDVGNISGVPSWMMLVLKEVLRKTGAANIREVWPNLEVFFHGGIAFDPYRAEYRKVLGPGVHYVETYNASEGFFGIQDDPEDHSMLLMLDYGIYYEFIPMTSFDEDRLDEAIPLHKTEVGVNYALVISTLGGLYRYLLGDTVRFTSTEPYKFVITGRTKSFINAFGEELMVTNADTALSRTCTALGCRISEYTAAPVFLDEEGQGYHHWIIEFDEAPKDLAAFTDHLDRMLKELNSDYEAKRNEGSYLKAPQVTTVPPGTFFRWLERKGKLGGQHKVPRLNSTDALIQELLSLSQE